MYAHMHVIIYVCAYEFIYIYIYIYMYICIYICIHTHISVHQKLRVRCRERFATPDTKLTLLWFIRSYYSLLLSYHTLLHIKQFIMMLLRSVAVSIRSILTDYGLLRFTAATYGSLRSITKNYVLAQTVSHQYNQLWHMYDT